MELKSVKSVSRKLKCRVHGIKKRCSNRRPIIVKPTVKRYFFICPQNIALIETPYILDSAQFVDDQGNAVQSFRMFGSSGYTNLFINGMMQGSGLYHITSK